MREVHQINVPYLVRFVWASGTAKLQWERDVALAKSYLLNRFPRLIVDAGLADFAPTYNPNVMTETVGDAVVTNHYPVRWSTEQTARRSHPQLVKTVGVYGKFDSQGIDLSNRWDLMRDIYQLALAPDCCKKAYFESPYRDPYHHLYEAARGRVKKLEGFEMNSLLAPLGLFISPIVPCSLDCKEAHEKGKEIAKLVQEDNDYVFGTLKMITEMPLRIDSYRGMACVDTPMFKGVFATDAYKEKVVLDVKPKNPDIFNYDYDWVAKGINFPFKGVFSGGLV
ncbi:hypothetical protein [Paenibacillus illinoisensis]|uniref:hypothetical protein n=1 Tax=Paenibacillus illinoisensis TaxID=59845 RepID=UPI003018FE78